MRLTPVKRITIAKAFGGGYREARIPAVIALSDGTLLLAFEARKAKNGDWGDIDIKVLRMDCGGSLTEVIKIGESDFANDGEMRTYGNPVLFALPNAESLLLYCKNYERVFSVKISEGGNKCSMPKEITDTFCDFPFRWNVCATGPGHGVRLESGRLICPIWLANGKYYDEGRRRRHYPSVSGCVYSDDGGETWQSGFIFDKSQNSSETSAARLKNGDVLFSVRNEEPCKRRISVFSKDEGATLEEDIYKTLTDPTCFGGMCELGDGVLHVNCQSPLKREQLTISYSENGIEWESLYTIKGAAGYADICAYDDKVFVFSEIADEAKGVIGELSLNIFKTSDN